jgi:hypothetical protein
MTNDGVYGCTVDIFSLFSLNSSLVAGGIWRPSFFFKSITASHESTREMTLTFLADDLNTFKLGLLHHK